MKKNEKYSICPKCGGRLHSESIGWRCQSCGEFVDLGLGQFYNKEDKPMTNEEKIRSLNSEGLAGVLTKLAYSGAERVWGDAFSKTFCKKCPTTECIVQGMSQTMHLHECDFADGECPHGDDCLWWLKQPVDEKEWEKWMS